MGRTSAGMLLYRVRHARLEVLLVHPGGPYFARKDAGAWTIPKGEPIDGEELLETARREFSEETGFVPPGPVVALSSIVQKGKKRIHAWAVEGDWDPDTLVCNTVTIEWPPHSGRFREFPEVDRAEWCSLDVARTKMNPAQVPWLKQLEDIVGPLQAHTPAESEGP